MEGAKGANGEAKAPLRHAPSSLPGKQTAEGGAIARAPTLRPPVQTNPETQQNLPCSLKIFLFCLIFFTICAENFYYKLCNACYKLANTYYKLCNACYKLCNKLFLTRQEKISGRKEDLSRGKEKMQGRQFVSFPDFTRHFLLLLSETVDSFFYAILIQ